jgi:hypothetical protein
MRNARRRGANTKKAAGFAAGGFLRAAMNAAGSD